MNEVPNLHPFIHCWPPLSLSSLSLPPFKQVFLLLANFRPQKYDLDLFEGFFMEKIAQIRYISKKIDSLSPYF
jgi:hypothetical protein